MALPPLELFSLREKAALLPGGLFVAMKTFRGFRDAHFQRADSP
jgi:hypothetical protein